jgi:hypothetical protein
VSPEKRYQGVPACSRAHAVCSCPLAHPRLAALAGRLLPGWGARVTGRLAGWVLGAPCWLDPDETVVPAHTRTRIELVWDEEPSP